MFSLTLAFAFLFLAGIQANSHESFSRTNAQDNILSLAKLRITDDGKAEELIPAAESEALSKVLTTTLPNNVQPLPSPCTGARPFTKLPHPEDKNKYIQCRDEFHYEIFACLNNGEYNDATKSCLVTLDFVDSCRDESPCLNGAQCISHKNGTFRCACTSEWTGERCETPLHICATKPCGINAECRPIIAVDYKQDYICICKGRKEYGPNCLETVPNPCLAESEQFFPFAFSQRLYIQCDGESLFFQPCAQSLYWNQEDKLCDRRRPGSMSRKGSMKKVVIKPDLNLDEKEKQTEKKFNVIDETTTFSTPVVKEEARPEQQRNQMLPELSSSLSNNRIRNNQIPVRDSFLAMDSQPAMNDRHRAVPSSQLIKTVFVPTEPVSGRVKTWQASGSRPVSETLEFNNRPTAPTQQWQQTPPKRVEPTEDTFSFNVPVGKVTEEQLLRPIQQSSQSSMVDQPRAQMMMPSQRWSNKPITMNMQNDQRFPTSQMNQPVGQNSGRGQMGITEMRDDAEMESRPEGFQSSNKRSDESMQMTGQVNVQQTQKPMEERPDRANQAIPFGTSSWTQQSTFNQPQQQRDTSAFANAQVPSNDQFMMNSMETTTIANTPAPSNQAPMPSPLTSWKPMRLNDQRLSGNTFSGQKPTEPTRVSDTTQKQIVASWRF